MCTHLRFYRFRKRGAKKYSGWIGSKIKDRVNISLRDEIVNQKKRLGDWESDTIIGKGYRGAIVTAVERVSYLVRISNPISKKADDVSEQMFKMLNPLKDKILTITTDNGSEFAKHKSLSNKLNYKHYFCDPYSSCQN